MFPPVPRAAMPGAAIGKQCKELGIALGQVGAGCPVIAWIGKSLFGAVRALLAGPRTRLPDREAGKLRPPRNRSRREGSLTDGAAGWAGRSIPVSFGPSSRRSGPQPTNQPFEATICLPHLPRPPTLHPSAVAGVVGAGALGPAEKDNRPLPVPNPMPLRPARSPRTMRARGASVPRDPSPSRSPCSTR